MENEKYIMLKKRINSLETQFNVESVNGDLSSEQQDLVRAFRLLCHAEIENYIEDLALMLLDKGVKTWNQNNSANYNIASLFINSNKIEKEKISSIQEKSNKLFQDYRNIVKHNNGIKEENIKKLFGPLGYGIDDFDSVFISNLTSFGTLRGKTAHTGAGSQIQQALNFEDEKIKVNHIIEGLKTFEETLYSK